MHRSLLAAVWALNGNVLLLDGVFRLSNEIMKLLVNMHASKRLQDHAHSARNQLFARHKDRKSSTLVGVDHLVWFFLLLLLPQELDSVTHRVAGLKPFASFTIGWVVSVLRFRVQEFWANTLRLGCRLV